MHELICSLRNGKESKHSADSFALMDHLMSHTAAPIMHEIYPIETWIPGLERPQGHAVHHGIIM